MIVNKIIIILLLLINLLFAGNNIQYGFGTSYYQSYREINRRYNRYNFDNFGDLYLFIDIKNKIRIMPMVGIIANKFTTGLNIEYLNKNNNSYLFYYGLGLIYMKYGDGYYEDYYKDYFMNINIGSEYLLFSHFSFGLEFQVERSWHYEYVNLIAPIYLKLHF